MGIERGLVRQCCAPGPEQASLIKGEINKLEEIKEEYYRENWSKMILKYMRYT